VVVHVREGKKVGRLGDMMKHLQGRPDLLCYEGFLRMRAEQSWWKYVILKVPYCQCEDCSIPAAHATPATAILFFFKHANSNPEL